MWIFDFLIACHVSGSPEACEMIPAFPVSWGSSAQVSERLYADSHNTTFLDGFKARPADGEHISVQGHQTTSERPGMTVGRFLVNG